MATDAVRQLSVVRCIYRCVAVASSGALQLVSPAKGISSGAAFARRELGVIDISQARPSAFEMKRGLLRTPVDEPCTDDGVESTERDLKCPSSGIVHCTGAKIHMDKWDDKGRVKITTVRVFSYMPRKR
jgi:hypothetical protein